MDCRLGGVPYKGLDVAGGRFEGKWGRRSLNRHQPKPGSQTGGRAIRRGEGGRCGDGRAFMVARGVGRWSCFGKISVRGTGTRATIKALPTPHPPLSPLRMLMGLGFG